LGFGVGELVVVEARRWVVREYWKVIPGFCLLVCVIWYKGVGRAWVTSVEGRCGNGGPLDEREES
jgi:hypothetical protein